MNKYTIGLLIIILASFNLKAQYSCASAVAITNGYTSSGWITTPGTNGVENWVSSATTCGSGAASVSSFTNKDVYLFKYTTGSLSGESIYFTILENYNTDKNHSIGVWSNCSGGTLSGCLTTTFKYKDTVGVCVQGLAANTTYYIGVGKEYFGNSYLKFKVIEFTVEKSTTIPVDECSSAVQMNIYQAYSGSTRCNYTASTSSPSGCGTIENDSWVKFRASSSTAIIEYNVFNCTLGYGVQLAVLSGNCGSNTVISGSCVNYASNNSNGTWILNGLTIGNTYYIRTDGYAGDLCSYSFIPVSGVLPIELLDFKIKELSKSHRQIIWSTASEENNNYFEILKSTDGQYFNSVAKINGSNKMAKTEYVFDEFSENSVDITYYQLKQVDFNNNVSYSSVISSEKIQDYLINLYPNPSATGIVNISGIDANSEFETLIFDMHGNKVSNYNRVIIKDSKLDLSDLTNGIYNVIIYNEKVMFSQKLFLQKVN